MNHPQPSVRQLDEHLHCVDLGFQGMPGVIAAYVLRDGNEVALIETGPGSTLETLLGGLRVLEIEPDRITKILVTHIHLDHAGAAGSLLHLLPNATLYVHEFGVPHMVDPSKLIASATRIYGDMMGPLWGPFEPAPADRIVSLREGDTIAVGGTSLRALYTPGHASHHVAFHDVERGDIFAGDVAAVRLQGMSYVRPPTPPPDLDLDLWIESVERLRDLRPRVLYLTHFGPFSDVDRHLSQARERLLSWADVVRGALEAGGDRDAILTRLRTHGDREIDSETGDAEAVSRYELATPYGMSVDGYLRYFRKRG